MASLAGSFLVARPVLRDPTFRQTVILLLQHDEAGAFGLVVNRPTQTEGLPFPVFSGGPCESQGLIMLHGHAEWAESSSGETEGAVAPGIFLGKASSLKRAQDASPGQALRFR